MAHYTWTPPHFGESASETEPSSPEPDTPPTPQETRGLGRHASPPDDSVIEHDQPVEDDPPDHDEVPSGDGTAARNAPEIQTQDPAPSRNPQLPSGISLSALMTSDVPLSPSSLGRFTQARGNQGAWNSGLAVGSTANVSKSARL